MLPLSKLHNRTLTHGPRPATCFFRYTSSTLKATGRVPDARPRAPCCNADTECTKAWQHPCYSENPELSNVIMQDAFSRDTAEAYMRICHAPASVIFVMDGGSMFPEIIQCCKSGLQVTS